MVKLEMHRHVKLYRLVGKASQVANSKDVMRFEIEEAPAKSLFRGAALVCALSARQPRVARGVW